VQDYVPEDCETGGAMSTGAYEPRLLEHDEYRTALRRVAEAERALRDFSGTAQDAGHATGILMQKPAPAMGVIHITREWSERHERLMEVYKKANGELGALRRRLVTDIDPGYADAVWTDVESGEHGRRFVVRHEGKEIVLCFETYQDTSVGWDWQNDYDDPCVAFPAEWLSDVIAALRKEGVDVLKEG
jgi:hypothetical protein